MNKTYADSFSVPKDPIIKKRLPRGGFSFVYLNGHERGKSFESEVVSTFYVDFINILHRGLTKILFS